jgi:hypothetical protein
VRQGGSGRPTRALDTVFADLLEPADDAALGLEPPAKLDLALLERLDLKAVPSLDGERVPGVGHEDSLSIQAEHSAEGGIQAAS